MRLECACDVGAVRDWRVCVTGAVAVQAVEPKLCRVVVVIVVVCSGSADQGARRETAPQRVMSRAIKWVRNAPRHDGNGCASSHVRRQASPEAARYRCRR